MSLVGKVGRRRWRARLAMGAVYVVLSLGALTTLYPFLLMLVTGFKGPTDQNDNRLVPAFWSTTTERNAKGAPAEGSLLEKSLIDKYAGDLSMIASTRVGGDATPEEIAAYAKFLMDLPVDVWTAGYRTAANQVTGRLAMRYQDWLRARYGEIDRLNQAYIEENLAFQTVVPPVEMWERRVWSPMPGRKWSEWLEFKATLPAEFRLPVREQRLYQEWQRAQVQNQFDRVPQELKGSATRFEELELPSGEGLDRFRREALPARYATSGAAEVRWADEGHLDPLPIAAFEEAQVRESAGEMRWEFSLRNYRYVLDYLILNGQALWVTVAFCGLAILVQLTVNPLAAYALSRYPIRQSGKILLFLLATMAFPAEVAMIPSFLLLKDLGLLNTLAALVLPAAASGYMIFLLKGFFDSLPAELYEAATLDGARELTMMRHVALPLSKPVLGYLALMAFMGAYGAFLYAFLVCQDQRVWTIMVWIYQLQNVAPKSVMMAALTVAALPTLLVFLLAQNVIMRGIVLPGER